MKQNSTEAYKITRQTEDSVKNDIKNLEKYDQIKLTFTNFAKVSNNMIHALRYADKLYTDTFGFQEEEEHQPNDEKLNKH